MKGRQSERSAVRQDRVLLPILLPLALGLGCATVGVGQRGGDSLVPTRHRTEVGPFVVMTNRPLDPGAPAIVQLAELEDEIGDSLGLRVAPRGDQDRPIEVYILEDREHFDHFLSVYLPALPRRRAFFIAEPPRRYVYTYFDTHLQEDLRHEATHALLNLAVGDLPLWLDEGLAEYFEVPPERYGINAEHLGRLPADVKGGWSPDLRRLEALMTVRDMTTRDYRESWLWVHYLMHHSEASRSTLLAFLAQPSGSTISDRLREQSIGNPASLLAHLDVARADPLAFSAPVPSRSALIRGQSTPPEPVVDRRPGVFARLFGGLFGSGRAPEPPSRPRRRR